MAGTPDGGFVAVWQTGLDGLDVMARKFDASAGPAEQRVNTYTPGDQTNAVAAAAGDGSYTEASMSCSQLKVAITTCASLLLVYMVPFTRADDKKAAFDVEADRLVRQAVYNENPRAHVQLDLETFLLPLPVVVIPEPLVKLYQQHPQSVLDLLLKIMDGGNPSDSVLAAAYAVELLVGRGVGVVCVDQFDPATYDTVDKGWGKTPRQHWIKKVRERMAAKKLSP